MTPEYFTGMRAMPVRYLLRRAVIKGTQITDAVTPLWMAGAASSRGCPAIAVPVVDVTNYVMLELGQPMHAYDLHERLSTALVCARMATAR